VTSPALAFTGVTLRRDGRTTLESIDLEVAPGERVALAGPSGSGKTSLLRLALGLEAPSHGTVWLRGIAASQGGSVIVPPEARGLAMVFQDLALWPHLDVHDNLAFALHRVPRPEREKRISEMLGSVELAGFGARMPSTLSGGERQRVAIARALITRPDLLLLDEAFANLDIALEAELLSMLDRVLDEHRTAALCVTHDPREARRLGGRVVVLEAGRIVQIGSLAELAAEPRTGFVRAFAAG